MRAGGSLLNLDVGAHQPLIRVWCGEVLPAAGEDGGGSTFLNPDRFHRAPAPARGVSPDRGPAVTRDIVVFSTADCRFCADARDLVRSLADEFPMRVREVDLGSAEAIAALSTWDVPFPPIVVVDGDLFGYGRISARRLRRHLERAER